MPEVDSDGSVVQVVLFRKVTDDVEASVLSSLSQNPKARDCLPQIFEIESGVAGPATARQEGVQESDNTGVRFFVRDFFLETFSSGTVSFTQIVGCR